MKKKRMVSKTLVLSNEVHLFLKETAEEEGVDMGEIFRRGISVMKAYRLNRKEFPHLGCVSDPGNLDVQLTGILNR